MHLWLTWLSAALYYTTSSNLPGSFSTTVQSPFYEENIQEKKYHHTFLFKQLDLSKSRHRKQLFWMNSESPTADGSIYHLSPAHLCKGQEIEFLHLLLAEPIAHSSASQESLHFSCGWPDVTVVPLQ